MAKPVTRLHLLIPGLLGPIPRFAHEASAYSVPAIERLLSRGEHKSIAGHDLSSSLFSLFGYSPSGDGDFPEGAVNVLGEGLEPENACWMRADPIHLQADRDRLLLFNSEHMNISMQEAETIASDFNRHFAAEGLRVITPSPDRWYITLEDCPVIKTHSSSQVVGRHIEHFMPAGADARRWRQLNNEMQMLLFQSLVNQQREAGGRLTINGIWLSGTGRLPESVPVAYAYVFAENQTAIGLAMLAGVPQDPIPDALEDAWRAGQETILLLTDLVSPVLNADAVRWSELLQILNGNVQRLLEAMKKMPQAELRLYPCNGECHWATAGSLHRFWRRTKKIQDMLEINSE